MSTIDRFADTPACDQLPDMGNNLTPLRSPHFRRYFTGHTLSAFGDGLVPVTVAFAALHVGGAGALGVILAANRVPIAALALVGGVLGDRWDRRWVMAGADALRMLTQTATGLLLVSGQAQVWHLVLLQAAAGAGTAMFTPASSGLVPALVTAEGLQRANATLGIATNTTRIASISTAGVLVATIGPGVALLADAATFACSLVAVLSLRIPQAARTTGKRGVWADVRDGARRVARTPWLRAVLLYSAGLQAVVIGPHMVAGPALAAEAYGGAGAWATIGVVQAVGSIVGGAVALRIRPHRPLTLAVGISLAMTPYLALFAAGVPLWLVATASLGVGMQGAVYLALQATVIQREIPEGERSRVFSWAQLANLVVLPASLGVAGPIVAVVGARPVLLTGAAWLVLSTLAVLASGVVGHKKSGPAPKGQPACVSAE